MVDIDYFGHMNNARYLESAEQARVDYLVKTGIFPLLMRGRTKTESTEPCGAVVASIQTRFIKELRYREQYSIETSIMDYCKKYFYMRHVFFKNNAEKQKAATVYAKCAFLQRDETRPKRLKVVPSSTFAETLKMYRAENEFTKKIHVEDVTLLDINESRDVDIEFQNWVTFEKERNFVN
eukprot:g6454.t1